MSDLELTTDQTIITAEQVAAVDDTMTAIMDNPIPPSDAVAEAISNLQAALQQLPIYGDAFHAVKVAAHNLFMTIRP